MSQRRLFSLALATSLLLAGCGGGFAGLPGLVNGGDGFDAQGTKGPRGANASDWTVFVYMGADNNLSDAGTLDLNEMEAGLSSDRVKFVVMADQEAKGDSRILEIASDAKGAKNKALVSKVVDDGGAVIPASREVDSGDPATLDKFVSWGLKNYPAKRSMLVIWNHGGGAFTNPEHLKSFCWDDASGNNLNLVDLWRVAQKYSGKMKFDVLGFDTCLLGHTETAFQMRDLSDFLVSSEKIEPGYGWDYQAIAKTLSANPGMYPRELSGAIVKSYQDFYKSSKQQTTLSAIDNQKLKDRLVPAVNALATELTANLKDPAAKAAQRQVAQKALQLSAPADEGENDAIDMGLFGNLLQQNAGVPAKTKELAKAMNLELQRATVQNLTTNLPSGVYNGIKLYFSEGGYNKAYGNASHQTFGTSAWARYVEAYHQR